MIEAKRVIIDGKEFILSKFPAVAGREIIAKYPISAIPKLGDYKVNEETMLKLMSFVAVSMEPGPRELCLSTTALIDNHVGSWETLAKIEMAMLEYNCSFFQNGRISTFLDDIAQKLPQWITRMLTDLLPPSSQITKPRSKNFARSTV